jgi:catechol 2,3-dioxygenase-like lactoylglutathione lyase family enzyme
MDHKGFSHIGLSTLDLDKTRAFYEGVLGFKPVIADTVTIEEGGHLRHMFFDVGGGQLIAFLEPNGVPDVPAKYDAGINRGLGVPAGFYHFAFEAGSAAALSKKRDELPADAGLFSANRTVGPRVRIRLAPAGSLSQR